MNNGLLEIGIVSFVYTPLVITVALLLCLWRYRIKDSRAGDALASLHHRLLHDRQAFYCRRAER